MVLAELAKKLRVLLSCPSEEAEINEFLNLLDEEIRNISASEDDDQQRRDFEEGLQVIRDEDVDFYQLQAVEIFLEVLIHSRPILSATTVIANWFETLIRPALREPRLGATAIEHAKSLVIEALKEGDEQDADLIKNFRRRLVDLYLLDAFNESSGKDILEWAELDEFQKNKNIWWKNNLEDILIRYGLDQPEELMDVMEDCFVAPSSRLQIVVLLDFLVSEPPFLDISSKVFTHSLMESIYQSLEVDNSATVCAVELSLLVKLLPAAAIKAYPHLKDVLPRLHGILGRVLCWKARVDRVPQRGGALISDISDQRDKTLVSDANQVLEDDIEDLKETQEAKMKVREDLDWSRLERTFDLSTASLPVPNQLFAILYFLFPCNTIHFLRNASEYLEEREVESPWTVGWTDALDDLQIRTVGRTLLRTHFINPNILEFDLDSELEADDRWSEYDLSRITGECMMLDPQTAGFTKHENDSTSYDDSATNRPIQRARRSGDVTTTQTPTLKNIQLEELPTRQRKVSLRDLIATSVALKSGADIHVSERTQAWPSILFTPPPSTVPSTTPSRSSSVDSTMVSESSSPIDETRIPTQISETIAGLQREALLLRTELNFELWLKRENVRHISRLHRDAVLAKNAENEQQRLQERLRDYRLRVQELQKELLRHQDQATKNKKDSLEWTEELSSKLADLRDQKKKWLEDAKTLKSEVADLKTHLSAQGKLLDAERKRVFELEAQIKTDAPKVDRLRDYEKRIEQLTAMLRLWDKDINQYNEQAKQMVDLIGEHQKMKIRVEGYGNALGDAETKALEYRRTIQRLEANLRSAERRAKPQGEDVTQMLADQSRERSILAENNRALREENEKLRDEIDRLTSLMEQASGTIGLVSPVAQISA